MEDAICCCSLVGLRGGARTKKSKQMGKKILGRFGGERLWIPIVAI
jgi:hypothetical protein